MTTDRRIEVLFFDGCPNVDAAIDRAHAASKGTRVAATVTLVRIRNEDEALRLRFLGSPTVRVDGGDVDPTAGMRDDFGMQCRLYIVDGCHEGAPPLDWIAAALLDERPSAVLSASVPDRCSCSVHLKP